MPLIDIYYVLPTVWEKSVHEEKSIIKTIKYHTYMEDML